MTMVQQEFDVNKQPTMTAGDCVSEEIKILLVGSPGVGKTSLIHTLYSDYFEPNVPAKIDDIIIPPFVTSENRPLHILDFSERVGENFEDLRVLIRRADVICLVFIAGDHGSLERVTDYWLPTIRECHPVETQAYKPIILVSNKDDILEDGYERPLGRITSILQEFAEIEAFIEVSAQNQKNVVELFHSAQNAVIYPLAPLFDPQSRVLTTKCSSALIQIFKLCDHDEDGLLSDHEMNLFQEDCFGTPLQREALDDLKSIIKQSIVDGIRQDCLTQTGFLFLHTLSIDNGRPEFTWQVLRKFDYDNQLNLRRPENIQKSSANDNNIASEDLSHLASFDDNQDQATRSSSRTFSDHFVSDDEDSILDVRHLQLPDWLIENSSIIKVGIGVSIATLFGLLALRYFSRGGHATPQA